MLRRQKAWDRVGIVGSMLCIAHCVSMPLLIGVLSVAGLGFLGGEWVHQVLALLLVGVAVLAFGPGFRAHGNRAVVALAVVGVGLLVGTGFVLEPLVSEPVEVGLTVAGSAVLVGAHVANWRLTSAVECCPSH